MCMILQPAQLDLVEELAYLMFFQRQKTHAGLLFGEHHGYLYQHRTKNKRTLATCQYDAKRPLGRSTPVSINRLP